MTEPLPTPVTATIDQPGSAGIPTAGSFDGSHTYTAAGTYVVTVRVTDDDAGYDEQEFEVLVNDVGTLMSLADEGGTGDILFTTFDAEAPRMMLSAVPAVGLSMMQTEATDQPPTLVLWGPGNEAIDEGWQDYIDLGTFTDPDSAGPFTFQVDWGDGSPIDTGTATIDLAGPPTAGSFDGRHAYSGSGDHIIGLTLTDNDGASVHEDFEVTVNNLPPTASIGGAPQQSPEGQAISLQANVTDPGPNDTFTYQWAVTKGESSLFASGDQSTFTFTPDDNGAYVVSLNVWDSDGAEADPAAAPVTIPVSNVAPTATFTNNGPVSVGATATVTFVNPTDPSSQDTQAGLHYAYDFDNDGTFEIGDGTYDGSVTIPSAAVPANFLGTTPGAVTIHGRIIDKDEGSTDYTTTIDVVKQHQQYFRCCERQKFRPALQAFRNGNTGCYRYVDRSSERRRFQDDDAD